MNHPKPKPNSKPPPAVASGANSHSRSNHRRATITTIELQQQMPLVRKGKNLGREGSIAGQRHGQRPPARRRASQGNAGSGGVIRSTGKSRHNEPTWDEDSISGVDSIIGSRGKKAMDLGANKFVPEQLETSSLVSMDSSSSSSSIDSVWSSSSAPVSMGMGFALSEAKFGKLFRSADVALPPMMAGGGNRNHSSRKVGLLRQVLQGSRSQAADVDDEVMSPSSQPLLQGSSSGSLLSSDGFTSESTSDSNLSTSASDRSLASDSSTASGSSSKLTSLSVLLHGIGSSRGGSSIIIHDDNDCKLCFDTMGKIFSTRRGCARMMVAVVGALALATLVYLGAENNSRLVLDEMPEGSSLFATVPLPVQEVTQGSQLRQQYQSLPQERNAVEVMLPKVVPEDQGNVASPHEKDDISSLEQDVVNPSVPLISPHEFGRNKQAELLNTLPNYKENRQIRRNKKARLRDTPPKYKEQQQKTNGNKLALKELRERNRKEHEDWGENGRN